MSNHKAVDLNDVKYGPRVAHPVRFIEWLGHDIDVRTPDGEFLAMGKCEASARISDQQWSFMVGGIQVTLPTGTPVRVRLITDRAEYMHGERT